MEPATTDTDPTRAASPAPTTGAPVDLTNCDREPIHIPGSVQPHGVLLALRKPDLTIVQVSRNAGALLGVDAEELVGQPASRVLAPADLGPLRQALLDGTLSAQPFHLLTVHAPPGGAPFDAIAHRHDGLVVLELEPAGQPEAYSAAQLYRLVQGALRRVESAGSLQAMHEVVATEVRRLNGFDRVMVYRFDDDYNGAVVAEAKRDDLEPFLGLHYPASDIPAQARDLYLRNRLRFIPDRDYVPSPVAPAINPVTRRPLDMSYSVLRSVSSIHCEYLRNMGVRASMSISLIRDGRLWGLVACHHYAGPRYVTHDVRTACELVGDVMGMQLSAKGDMETAAYAASMDAVRWALARRTEEVGDVAPVLTESTPNLLDLVRAGGAAIVQDDRVTVVGQTPPPADLLELARWLSARSNAEDATTVAPEAFHTASIAQLHEPFDRLTPTAAGVLAVPLIRGRPHYVMWFRPEQVRTVNWAGDPAKSVVKGEAGVRLSPRGSFALWTQTVRRTAEPWTPAEVRSALALQRDVVGVSLRRGETLAKLYEELRASYTQLGSAASLLAQSEERLRLATEAGAVGIWDWDVTTGRVALSAEYYRVAGVEPGRFAGTFAAITETVHPDDRPRFRAAVDGAKNGRTEFAAHYRLCCPPFADRWVAGRGRFAYNAAGLPTRLVAVAVDITDAKAAEAERVELLESERAARAEAERAGRLKDDFLATLSHELRTPLNAIIGWSVLLRGPHVEPDEVAEGMEAIERNARVQAQLVEDLLDVSRIIAGKMRLDVQHVDLAAVVDAAVAGVTPAAQAKTVRLQKVLDPRATAVWGDPNRLQQVLWNLLSNAIKFTPKGGRVQVSVARVNSHVELTVADSGMGIPPEFLPHVFDRFRQADASTTRAYGGLGLGLAIVRHLVELHGGTVAARSDGPGTGATFVVRLPLKATEQAVADGGAGRPSGGVGECPESPSLAGLRVLVVDDEPDARHLIRRILEQCGTVVTTAANVPEALTALAGGRFDAIVSDVGMPGQDGYDLIRQVRAMPTDAGGRTPAVALTAMARVEDRRRALLAGFQIHVPKPVDPAELLAVVASIVGRTG
jgi:light-regulated signal transduction histidine kinase (bacteriophytochrome)